VEDRAVKCGPAFVQIRTGQLRPLLSYNESIISSGSGKKNSGGTLNFPLARPKGRFVFRLAEMGCISAMGTSRLHRTTISPLTTCSRYFERWVFAS
jgi:hypothetical protein